MKKKYLLFLLPFLFCFTLSAQITQKEADEIIQERLSRETNPYLLYTKDRVQDAGITILSSPGEKIKLNYPCWVYYYIDENSSKYLIVKETNGNLLEISATNTDLWSSNWEEWRIVSDIQNSVWQCFGYGNNVKITLTFYPSIHKVFMVAKTSNIHLLQGVCIIHYYIADNKMYLRAYDEHLGFCYIPWRISRISENEMRIEYDGFYTFDKVGSYRLICQTEYNEI